MEIRRKVSEKFLGFVKKESKKKGKRKGGKESEREREKRLDKGAQVGLVAR